MNSAFISTPPLLRRPPTVSKRSIPTARQQPPNSNDDRGADFDSIVNWVLKGPSPTSSTNPTARNANKSSPSNSARNHSNRRNAARQRQSPASIPSSSNRDTPQFSENPQDDSPSARPVFKSGTGFRDDSKSSDRTRSKRNNRGSRARSDAKTGSSTKHRENKPDNEDGDDVDIDQDLDLVDDVNIVDEERESTEVELSQVDDNVDDGFFSRYKKETSNGRHVANYTYLDSEDPDADDYFDTDTSFDAFAKPPSRKQKPLKKMDREKAASAFDAMDRLFGSLKSNDQPNEPADTKSRSNTRNEKDQQPNAKEGARQRREMSMNRAAWLADVRARAATKENRSQRSAADSFDDSPALDVDAVESPNGDTASASAIESSAEDNDASPPIEQVDEFAEAKIGQQDSPANSVQRTSGFKDQEKSQTTDVNDRSFYNNDRRKGNRRADVSEKMFDNLVTFARQGPGQSTGTQPQSAGTRSRKSRSTTLNSEQGSQKFPSHSKPRGQQRKPEQQSQRSDADISSLLGLTKRIASTDKFEPENEPESEIETVMQWGNSKSTQTAGKSQHTQKYTAVRRIGGRSRGILAEPEMWKPMDESDVGRVRSDNRPLDGGKRNSKKNLVVAECRACHGTGLETCEVCRGSGWISPLSKRKKGTQQDAVLEEIWNHPNLVVDSNGEAQCINCNGIGKQLCKACEGSGLRDVKGFNIADKNKVFDIFPVVDKDSFPDDMIEYFDDDDDAIEYDEEEEDEEEEIEYFQLYQGPDAFTDEDKDPLLVDPDDMDAGDGEEVIDVEDESAELLAALEAMHLAESGQDYLGQDNDGSDILDSGNVDADDDDENDDELDEDDEEFSIGNLRQLGDASEDINDDDELYEDLTGLDDENDNPSGAIATSEDDEADEILGSELELNGEDIDLHTSDEDEPLQVRSAAASSMLGNDEDDDDFEVSNEFDETLQFDDDDERFDDD